jgi:DNA-binding HxlR family transcriptional regulator
MNVSKANETNIISPIGEMFSHLGRPCSVPLIFALGERSYSTSIQELRKSIDLDGKRVSEATVSKCLSGLTEIGVVVGTAHANSLPKEEFQLTSKGQQLYRHLLQLRHLAEKTPSEYDLFDGITAC